MNLISHNTKVLLIIAFLKLSLSSLYGQQYNLKPADIEGIRLKKIVEWVVSIDSTNTRKDSSHTLYTFDSLGRLTEKKYNFSYNDTWFVSVKYVYNINGFLIDSIYKDPYSIEFSNLLDPPDSTEFIVYEYNRIKKKINTWRAGIQSNMRVEELNYTYGNLYLKNKKEYVYFNASNSPSIFKYKFVIQNGDRCLQDKKGDIFCDVWFPNLIDFIEFKENNLIVSQTRFEYYF